MLQARLPSRLPRLQPLKQREAHARYLLVKPKVQLTECPLCPPPLPAGAAAPPAPGRQPAARRSWLALRRQRPEGPWLPRWSLPQRWSLHQRRSLPQGLALGAPAPPSLLLRLALLNRQMGALAARRSELRWQRMLRGVPAAGAAAAAAPLSRRSAARRSARSHSPRLQVRQR